MERSQKKEPRKKWPNSYGRYAGLGFQMAGSVFFLTWLGLKADKLAGFEYPILTIAGALIGISAAMYFLFKQTKPE